MLTLGLGRLHEVGVAIGKAIQWLSHGILTDDESLVEWESTLVKPHRILEETGSISCSKEDGKWVTSRLAPSISAAVPF